LPIFSALPNTIVTTLLEIPSRLAAVPARVLLKVASARLPFPPELRHRVMTVQDAARLVAWSLVDLPLETVLRPIPAEWDAAKWVMGKWKLWEIATRAFPGIGAWLAIVGTVKDYVVRLAGATITCAGSIVLVLALLEFAKRLNDPKQRAAMFSAALPQDSLFVRVNERRRVRRNARTGPDR
jgi:hypothetical protein